MTDKRLALLDALDRVLLEAEREADPARFVTTEIENLKDVLADIGIRDSFLRSMSWGKLISLALEKTDD